MHYAPQSSCKRTRGQYDQIYDQIGQDTDLGHTGTDTLAHWQMPQGVKRQHASYLEVADHSCAAAELTVNPAAGQRLVHLCETTGQCLFHILLQRQVVDQYYWQVLLHVARHQVTCMQKMDQPE